MGRRLEYEVKTSVRLNMSNPQHVKINDVIQNLDPKIFKSKNQFIIDAIQFYIDNYGKLSVIDADGKLVESWTSEAGKTHMIERLPVGKYTLREESAPYGYKGNVSYSKIKVDISAERSKEKNNNEGNTIDLQI